MSSQNSSDSTATYNEENSNIESTVNDEVESVNDEGTLDDTDSENTLSNMCKDFADTKDALKNYLKEHKTVLNNLKVLRKSVKQRRADIIEAMTSKSMSSYTDEATGLAFTTQKREYCTFTKTKLEETLGAEAIQTYKRKFSQKKDVVVVMKKSKNM